MIRIEIETENAAFEHEDNGGPEVARILHELAIRLGQYWLACPDSASLYDINGNKCGRVVVG